MSSIVHHFNSIGLIRNWSYSPEMLNSDWNWIYFVLCYLEIRWMTLENNRAHLLYYIKLCASFQIHRWNQSCVTVRKLLIWVNIDFFVLCDLEIQWMTLKNKSDIKRQNTLGAKISIWHNIVVLWNSRTVKQSMWLFCLIQIKRYSSRGSIPLWLCVSMCTGVETVKQSLNSIETNLGLFHSLNAHHHNANK